MNEQEAEEFLENNVAELLHALTDADVANDANQRIAAMSAAVQAAFAAGDAALARDVMRTCVLVSLAVNMIQLERVREGQVTALELVANAGRLVPPTGGKDN